jgi:hypothetical protein
MHIARNPINKQIIENNIGLNDGSINFFLKEIEQKNYLVIRGLEQSSLANLCNAAAVEHPIDKQAYYLDMFIDASLAKYQMATNIGKEITINFLGKQHQVVPPAKNYSVSEQNWITGYMAALAQRKMAIVKLFCDIDLDLVHQNKKTQGGEYSLLFAKFLKRLFNKGEPHGKNLLAAANKIQENEMPASTYDYALHIDGPVIDMFTPILINDKNDFNRLLLQALELHKKYWTKQQENLVDGLISLPITALTVMAKNYDFDIDHTSDYLLQFLIDS